MAIQKRRETNIVCDNCYITIVGYSNATIRKKRKEAQERGAVTIKQGGVVKDYCAGCKNAIKS